MILSISSLETRLLTRESTVGGTVGSSVTRCAAKYQALFQSISVGDESSVRPDPQVIDGFVREILLFKLDTKKCENVFAACEEEIAAYHDLEKTIKERIEQANATNNRLEIELEQERKIRSHREELESVAKGVNALPTRASLKRKIDHTESNIDSVGESLRSMDNRITQRQQQLSVLLQAIADLQNKLPEEEEAAAAAAAAAALAAGEAGADEEEDDIDRDDGGDGRASARYDSEVAGQATKLQDDDGDGAEEGAGEVENEPESSMPTEENIEENPTVTSDNVGDIEEVSEAIETEETSVAMEESEPVLDSTEAAVEPTVMEE